MVQGSTVLGKAARIVSTIKDMRGVPSYRIISRRAGRHQYRRKDFQEAVVAGIQRRYGEKWKLVEDKAGEALELLVSLPDTD